MSARKWLILPAIIALFGLSPVPVRYWTVEQNRWIAAVPQVSLTELKPQYSADLDGDAFPETLSLSAGTAVISHLGTTAWQSPDGWTVRQAAFADLNRDGLPEAVLLVWRKFAPWPIDRYIPNPGRIDGFHDAQDQSCHIILIGWRNGNYREAWAGSALAEPVRSFAVIDANQDGKVDLVTLDGNYTDPDPSYSWYLSVWEWNGFGFSLIDKIPGSYRRLAPAMDPSGKVMIVAGK